MFKALVGLARKAKGPRSAQRAGGGCSPSTLISKSTAVSVSGWQLVLTAPIEQLCEAPSADTVRYAYDLYAQEVYAPFAAREARMASRLSDIRACFATLVARAPELVEAALAEHPQVFADIVRLQKRGRP